VASYGALVIKLGKGGPFARLFDFFEMLSPHCRLRRIARKNRLAAFTVSE
jgi:hypothetical protein